LTFIVFLSSVTLVSAQNHRIDSLRNALKIEKEDTSAVKTLNLLSDEEETISNFDSSMICGEMAEALAKRIGYKRGLASSEMAISLIYYYQGNFPRSLEYTFKALSVYQEIGLKRGIANAYNMAGGIYASEENRNKAEEYYNRSLAINQELGSKNGIANNYGNLGLIYKEEGEYAKAHECLRKSYQLHKEVNNQMGMSNNIGNEGGVYELQDNFSMAIECMMQALQIARDNGIKRNVESNLGAIGDVYTKLKNYALARQYIDSSLAIAKQLGIKLDIEYDYGYLYSLDSAKHDYQKTLEDYKLYEAYHDSLVNEANNKAQLSLEFEQRQAVQKAEQDKKDVIAEQEKSRQVIVRNALIGGVILITILVFLLLGRYRTKEKTATLLEEQNRVISEHNNELERLSIVARETENVILIMDPEGRIEWANESFTRMNGITIEELKKKKGETIYEISNNPEINRIIDTAIRERRTIVYESLNRNKGGEKIWESSTLTPIFDNKTGALRKIIIIDTDVTRRKLDEETIRQKNKDITDSIIYAKRLQDAIMPPIGEIEKIFPDSFVIYKPKDIVAGDFYWLEQEGDTILIAACDCTGHGVPGALVSVVCSNALNRALNEYKLRDTGRVLDKVRELVLQTFEKSDSLVQDGMDISFCAINLKEKKVEWSGANNPLWYLQNGEIKELAADKQPIGKQDNAKPFTTQSIDVKKGDVLYLLTDGFADQFGGPKGKKYKYNQLKEKLLTLADKNMGEQKSMLEKEFETWKGALEQTDDVCLIGIRI
jgi:PAS domain S-box-containing protein